MRFVSRLTVGCLGLLCAAAVAQAQTSEPPVSPLPAPLPAGVFAEGVSIDGIPVGGATAAQARATLLKERVAPRLLPFRVTLQKRSASISPQAAGYSANLNGTINQALRYGRAEPITGPVDVPLIQTVDAKKLRNALVNRSRTLNVPAVSARLTYAGAKPRVSKARLGIAVNMDVAVPAISKALISRTADQSSLPFRRVRPAATTIGANIVISRANRTLTLYRGARVWRTFRIAVGTSSHPTPRGKFRIISKQRNPTWIPPDSPWARGLGPVPPGLGNPLGTRWIGINAPAIGIHGTPASGSIGTAASHGCIRMYINQSEWIFERVSIDTPVLIV